MRDSLAADLAAVARTMGRAPNLDATLDAIVRSCAASLPSFEHVGLSTTTPKHPPRTRAVTSDVVAKLDHLQYELGEGPCVETLRGDELVSAPLIRHDQRWPQYVSRAVQSTGLRSQLALRLYVDDQGTVGGLNIYSTTNDQIEEEDVYVAQLFAAHASVALGHAWKHENLQQAIHNRTVIGNAIGLVMERFQLDNQAAFAYLARMSSTSNEKLKDIAAQLVDEANARVPGNGARKAADC
jgi:GAF domain-containing protein